MILGQPIGGSTLKRLLCLTLLFLLTGRAELTLAKGTGDDQQPSSRDIQAEASLTVAQNRQTTNVGPSRGGVDRATNFILIGDDREEYSFRNLNPGLDHGPDHPYTHYNLGLYHCKRKQNALAISDFDEALRLDPDFAAAYHFRGLLRFERREFERALSDLNQALRLDPKLGHAELYRDRASLCLQRGLHCNRMDGDRCEWTMWLGRSAYFRGLKPYFGTYGKED